VLQSTIVLRLTLNEINCGPAKYRIVPVRTFSVTPAWAAETGSCSAGQRVVCLCISLRRHPPRSSFFVYTIRAHLWGAVCPSAYPLVRLCNTSGFNYVRWMGAHARVRGQSWLVHRSGLELCSSELSNVATVIVNYVLASVMSPARDVRIWVMYPVMHLSML